MSKILLSRAVCTITAALLTCVAVRGFAAEASDKAPGFKHCGLYVHACWLYNYPFATRTWNRQDYDKMFRLLRILGYDRVMLWPMMEAIPMPMSAEDAEALRDYRNVVEDARKDGLECWLVQSVCTTDRKIAEKPWSHRNFYAVRKDVRLDDPAQAEPWFQHRAAMLAVLNNADAYVTIDSDPGGYPGAKAEDYFKVFQRDRQIIDRVGARPTQQKVVPWLWGGWGTRLWTEPTAPQVARELAVFSSAISDGWELMPGRNGGDYGCGRVNMGLVDKAGLMPYSTLMLYDSIEAEPGVPNTKLQFQDIRRALRQELQYAGTARGCFGNCQTAILELPNIYFFLRGARDPRYLDKADGAVLADFAEVLGGPPELLVPAWSCLQLGLDQLPADLPSKLRKAELKGKAAAHLPGGSQSYLNTLAAEVESRRRLLKACDRAAGTEEEAAHRLADGIGALVDWWELHGYVFDRDAKVFQWDCVWPAEREALFNWARRTRRWPNLARLAAEEIVRKNTLPANIARSRVDDVLGQKGRE